MVPGYIAASFLTGRIGRKLTVVLFIGAAAVAGYAFAFADSMKVVYASNFALAFFSLGAWGVWDTWVAELYPTSLRTVGYGWMIFAQRIANIVAPSTIGALLAAGSSFTVTTTMINAFMVASVILAFSSRRLRAGIWFSQPRAAFRAARVINRGSLEEAVL